MAIENISDTARWVAAFRARESERPDALFRDPFARSLAGARGFELAQQLPGAGPLGWTMAIRTRVLDELLLEAVWADRCDMVINLAAGLDTRPQRLNLPKHLRWVEADLPGILEHKEQVLGPARASCALERVRVDLADGGARRALLARLGREAKRAVVLTEGLLVYLPEVAVAELARELHAEASLAYWMMDMVSTRALQFAQVTWNRQLALGGAKMQFGPREGARWFNRFGWKVRRALAFADEGARLKRGLVNRLWGALGWALPPHVRAEVRAQTALLWLQR